MTTFESFVKKEKKSAQNKGGFNACEQIEKFKHDVDNFYKKIENEWLKTFIQDGDINVSRFPITISEERLGVYQIDAETLSIGGKRFSFTPIGTILIGTDARIDVSSGTNTSIIIKNGRTWNWLIQDRQIKLVPLNTESFQKMIMELAK